MGYLAIHLVKAAIECREARKILVIVTPPLIYQYKSRLSSVQTSLPVYAVDAKAYRELESSVSIGQNPWPREGVVVLGFLLASKAGITESLAESGWDLLVVDEGHLLSTGSARKLLSKVLTQRLAKRSLFLSVTAPKLADLTDAFSVTTLDDSDLVDWEGRQVFQPERLFAVEFRRTPEEDHLLKQIEACFSPLEGKHLRLGANILCRQAASSLMALESGLNQLRRRIDPDPGDPSLVADEPVGDDEQGEKFPSRNTSLGLSVLAAIGSLDNALEAVEREAKYEALLGLLRSKVQPPGLPSRNACIVCEFRATASFVCHSLDDLGYRTFLLTADQPVSIKREVLRHFLSKPGILVGTFASISIGMNLHRVDTLVLYDFPHKSLAATLISRFNTFGRTKPLEIYHLRDATASWQLEARRDVVSYQDVDPDEPSL